MSMSDCIKCWDTPCVCGYAHRKESAESRISQAATILGIDKQVLKQKLGDIVPAKHPADKE